MDRPLFRLWVDYCFFLLLTTLAAGSAACYVAFVGCQKPVRRLLDCVLLPAPVSLVVVVEFYAFRSLLDPQGLGQHSVVDSDTWNAHGLLHLAANLGTGIQFAGVGLLLVAVFLALLLGRYTSLPVRLKAPSTAAPDDVSAAEEHRRMMLFVWTMIGLVVLSDFPDGSVRALALLLPGLAIVRHGILDGIAFRLMPDLSFLLFVLLAVGSTGRKMIPGMFRLPALRYFALSALVPAALADALPLAEYCQARIAWSGRGWGRFMAPVPGSFLAWPTLDSLWLFLPALAEGIAWRGHLQPRFIRRYGLFRGIFLVGVVWGALHIAWDFHWQMSAGFIVLSIFTRIGTTVLFCYALAWLTIQSESVLPAAIAHAACNVFLDSSLLQPGFEFWLFTVILWGTAGFLLFRFFPPASARRSDVPEILEPAQPQPSGV